MKIFQPLITNLSVLFLFWNPPGFGKWSREDFLFSGYGMSCPDSFSFILQEWKNFFDGLEWYFHRTEQAVCKGTVEPVSWWDSCWGCNFIYDNMDNLFTYRQESWYFDTQIVLFAWILLHEKKDKMKKNRILLYVL